MVSFFEKFKSPYPAEQRRTTVAALSVAVMATATFGAYQWWTDNSITATVNVDGVEHVVTYRGNTVEGALAAAGVDLSAGDRVEPALGQKVPDGAKVTIVHSRDVTVEKDGKIHTASVAAMTVGQALSMMKIDAAEADISPSKESKIERDGGKITVRSARAGTVTVDGREVPISVVADTVRDALTAAEIPVGDEDEVSPGLDEEYVSGTDITVKRVTTEQQESTSYVRFKTVKRKDASLAQGKRKVIRQGVKGKKKILEEIKYIDGEETSREVVSTEWVRKVRNRVVAVGTKVIPKATPKPSESTKPSPSTKPTDPAKKKPTTPASTKPSSSKPSTSGT